MKTTILIRSERIKNYSNAMDYKAINKNWLIHALVGSEGCSREAWVFAEGISKLQKKILMFCNIAEN